MLLQLPLSFSFLQLPLSYYFLFFMSEQHYIMCVCVCVCVCVIVLVIQSCPTLCNPMDCIARQAPPAMRFPRQEYWSGLPFSSPEDLLYPGNKPRSPAL